MTALQLVVLALIQGVSEFLPVSSSAHLILASRVFESWTDQGLAFDAAVHVGTLAAVMIYFRADLARLGAAALGRDSAAFSLLLALGVATLPVILAGALLSDWIELWLREPLLIALTTIVFGLALGAADRWGRGSRTLSGMRLGPALAIGLAQVLALVPGTSRSGITITAALALGYDRETAARFSFLLSIPVIAAAGGWGFVSGIADGGRFEFGQFAAGALIAGVIAWITIAAFMAWLRRFGMAPFVVYRLLLGGLLLIWFWPDGSGG